METGDSFLPIFCFFAVLVLVILEGIMVAGLVWCGVVLRGAVSRGVGVVVTGLVAMVVVWCERYGVRRVRCFAVWAVTRLIMNSGGRGGAVVASCSVPEVSCGSFRVVQNCCGARLGCVM